MRTPAAALRRLLAVLGTLDVPYEVGGSVASSAHGIPRTTMDIDIVVDLSDEKIDAFTTALAGEFYADALLIRESFAKERAANLIHLATAWKFDLFPKKRDEYSRTEFERRALRTVRPAGDDAVECMVASAEDVILRKLEWYRAGGEQSERQWHDILGVWRANATRLDRDYLQHWAGYLKLNDLMARLLDTVNL